MFLISPAPYSRFKNTNVNVRGSIPKRKLDQLSGITSLGSDVSGGLASFVLPSPSEETAAGSTANSSVASTPTAEMEIDPALLMPAPEESPYFPEKYSGKLCVLCNLGERSQLGQGEILRIEVKDDAEKALAAVLQSQEGKSSADGSGDKSPKTGTIALGVPPLLNCNKRQKGLNKCK